LPRQQGPLAQPAYWNLVLPDGKAGRAIGLKFLPKVENENGKTTSAPELVLVVASSRQALERTLAILATMLVAAGLLTILITVPMVGFSLRRGHAPLELLARQAAAINADSLQSRFPEASMPEELQPITKRLNDLLGRLEASFERERRFSADLAHELRTPLAELRAHAEVEMQCAEGTESEKHRETLDITLQMEAMVTRLLELARSENKQIPVHAEPVMVARLIEDLRDPLTGKAQNKQLAVKNDVPPEVSLQTDPTLFRSILANLMSNAIEYAPKNGCVAIEWMNETGELRVSNTIHDLNADDVPHLFERLWRKDKSRTGTEHCGLGLALSSEFAKLLGMSLTARLAGEKTLILSLKTRDSEA
jgi:signal transduction histidine kinase